MFKKNINLKKEISNSFNLGENNSFGELPPLPDEDVEEELEEIDEDLEEETENNLDDEINSNEEKLDEKMEDEEEIKKLEIPEVKKEKIKEKKPIEENKPTEKDILNFIYKLRDYISNLENIILSQNETIQEINIRINNLESFAFRISQ